MRALIPNLLVQRQLQLPVEVTLGAKFVEGVGGALWGGCLSSD